MKSIEKGANFLLTLLNIMALYQLLITRENVKRDKTNRYFSLSLDQQTASNLEIQYVRHFTQHIQLLNQQKLQLNQHSTGPQVICLTSSWYFNGETTALFQLCCWRKQISESVQDVKMYHKHSEGEGKRGHWLGRRRKRRKRKAVVIRAEHYSKCRRMQVVPMVLDEVLLSCWATKQFIYKTVTAYRHGRGNRYAYCSFFPPNQSTPHFSLSPW